jgi:hypothetical protein
MRSEVGRNGRQILDLPIHSQQWLREVRRGKESMDQEYLANS